MDDTAKRVENQSRWGVNSKARYIFLFRRHSLQFATTQTLQHNDAVGSVEGEGWEGAWTKLARVADAFDNGPDKLVPPASGSGLFRCPTGLRPLLLAVQNADNDELGSLLDLVDDHPGVDGDPLPRP